MVFFKKLLFPALVLALLLAAAGCSSASLEEDAAGEELDQDEAAIIEPERDGEKRQDPGGTGGSAEGCLPFGGLAVAPESYFGKSMEEINGEFGSPHEQGPFEGSECFYYSGDGKQVQFYFWGPPPDGVAVRGIRLSGSGTAVAGVEIGMTVPQIKAVLGAPVFEGHSEYYDQVYALIFERGELTYYFYTGSETEPTESVFIKYIGS